MKYINTPLFSLAALSLTLFVGCKPVGERTSATETTGQQMTRTEVAVGDASHDWQAYTYEQKTQFVTSMEAELASINRDIEALATRIERSDADAKAAATPRLDELRRQADLLETHIDEVRNANASNWDKVKATTRESYDTLKDNFKDARQWMSDRLAP